MQDIDDVRKKLLKIVVPILNSCGMDVEGDFYFMISDDYLVLFDAGEESAGFSIKIKLTKFSDEQLDEIKLLLEEQKKLSWLPEDYWEEFS